MKKAVLLVALAVGVLLLPGVRDLSAQSAAIAKVPFPFVVQGTVLPAGEYRVAMRPGDKATIQIASTEDGTGVFVAVSPGDVSKHAGDATFVFRRLGGAYFLSRVSIPGDEVREIPTPTGSEAARLAQLAQPAQPASAKPVSGKPTIQG